MTLKARAQEALEELPEPCPVCGRKPIIGYGKKQGCQMHGGPMQAVTVSCRPDCFGRPFVSAGDVYNGGKHKARQLAIGEWNEKCRQAAAWRTHSPAINQESDTKEARAYAELRKSFQAVIAERDEARAALKRNQWALTKAAACMLKPDNGVTDTVWLSDGITLYDHLCCEIDGIENIITGNVEHDIEALEKHAAAVKRGEG